MLYEPQKHGFLKKIHAFYRSSLLLKIEKYLIINQLTNPSIFHYFVPHPKLFEKTAGIWA